MKMENFNQSELNRQKNENYFSENLTSYQANITEIDTYINIKNKLDTVLAGAGEVLDIGNGGVFDYDTNLIKHITAIDLFLDKILTKNYPPNVSFKKGSALDIPEKNEKFDVVVMVMLLHHIVGETVAVNHHNLSRCLDECLRVLKPEGKLVIVESCLPQMFYKLQSLIYPISKKLIEKSLTHPMAFQYTKETILQVLNQRFSKVEYEEIPKGRYVLQLGWRFPSRLTPVQPFIFYAEKTPKI